MSESSAGKKARRVVFVSRSMSGEGLRTARAIRELDNVFLLGICEDSTQPAASEVFVDLLSVGDAHDPAQLIDAARMLSGKHGPLDQIVTSQETLLEPVAHAVAAIGLAGMSVNTVRRALDKSLLKQILTEAGIKTPRHQLITNQADARRFADDAELPLVLKPLGGSGGLATWCVRTTEELELALELMLRPQESWQENGHFGEGTVMAEAHLRGQELCLDTITVANEPRFHSICYYRPSILEALENPRIQWSCVMPRDISGPRYQIFIEDGVAAVRALRVGNAMTHMEGFLDDTGHPYFTDATLRPAGARIGPMLAFAYDMDPYRAWARVAVDGAFDGPWERKYAVGTIFLRGQGTGTVESIHGIELVKTRLDGLLVETRLPRVGATKSATYTGDGYITVRHPETNVVEEALDFIAEEVHITYSDPESPIPFDSTKREHWGQRLQYFSKQLNKPAWDSDVPA